MKRADIFPIAMLATLSACGDDQPPNGEAAQTSIPKVNITREVADQAKQTRNEGQQGEEPNFNRDMTYYYSRGERGPTLSFGVPRTDNIALTLRCPAGAMSKTVLVYFNRPSDVVAERPDTLRLKAGGAQRQLAVETRETQLGTTVEVQTSPDSAPIQAFRNGNTLEVAYGDEAIAIPSRSGDEEIQEFFGACLA